MNHVFKFSDAFVLALHSVAMLCSEPDKLVSTRDIAKKLNASEYHLSKILQRLSKAGFVTPVRGPKGGFKLSKPPEEVTVADIYRALEGPLEFSCCLMDDPVCKGDRCILNGLSKAIVKDLKNLFIKTTLSMIDDIM